MEVDQVGHCENPTTIRVSTIIGWDYLMNISAIPQRYRRQPLHKCLGLSRTNLHRNNNVVFRTNFNRLLVGWLLMTS